jgi:hypothetical protein
VSYRRVIDEYPGSPSAETALWRSGLLYEKLERFDLAAQTFSSLGEQYPNTRYDAWFHAAEVYRRRLNRNDLARAAYLRVAPTSARHADARDRLADLDP